MSAAAMQEESWHHNKSVIECNQYMLEHSLGSDITFILVNEAGEEIEKIQAHKYMLASRSPVFLAMFYGNLKETGDVKLKDVEPKAFHIMLNYIYTDEIDIPKDISLHLAILYVAKKYFLSKLIKVCLKYILAALNKDNVFEILDQCLNTDQNELIEKCVSVIESDTKPCLESKGFLEIRPETLSFFLNRDHFTVTEDILFSACVKWAKAALGSDSRTPAVHSGSDIRNQLGDCIRKIRFGCIDAKTFSSVVTPSKVLTTDEELDMYRYLSDKAAHPLPRYWSSISRYTPLIRLIITRDQIGLHPIGTLQCAINVTSNKAVEVTAFVIGSYHATHSMIQGVSCDTKTTLIAITMNGEKINGSVKPKVDGIKDSKQDWIPEKPCFLRVSENKLIFHFSNDQKHRFGATEDTAAAKCNVLLKQSIVLNDGIISLQFNCTNREYLPLLGVKYID